MNTSEELKDFLAGHRPEILAKWSELWMSIQKRRPESGFPDPPYEAILNALPYDPLASPTTDERLLSWFSVSPIFCTGAAFCQLQAVSAHILYKTRRPTRHAMLSILERSLEDMIMQAGTRKWISTVLKNPVDNPAAHSERMAVIGQLAAGVAHEIGNPLAAISSIAQVLERRTEDRFFAEQLGHVKKSVDRIARIVRELTDFSRPLPTQTSKVAVNDILATALRLARYDRRVGDVSFVSELAPDLPLVDAVPDQLLQVFLNLLINALDATGGSGTVTARTWSAGGEISISITDTGHGIPEEIMGRIFDPFFTTKPFGKGTGLGLSVSFGILARYGGRIETDSEPGKGATFIVTLPAA